MMLVIGGCGAGKREFVQSLGFSAADMSSDPHEGTPVVFGIHELMRNAERDDLFAALSQKSVLICDEVGSGVVPLDKQERQWRENVGRLCCDLAQEAQTVVRVCCGIPQVIKGTI